MHSIPPPYKRIHSAKTAYFSAKSAEAASYKFTAKAFCGDDLPCTDGVKLT